MNPLKCNCVCKKNREALCGHEWPYQGRTDHAPGHSLMHFMHEVTRERTIKVGTQ